MGKRYRSWSSELQHFMTQALKVLQHWDIGIVDQDTEELIEIESGEVVGASILSIIKGTEGNPR